jgi:hypothetical protein
VLARRPLGARLHVVPPLASDPHPACSQYLDLPNGLSGRGGPIRFLLLAAEVPFEVRGPTGSPARQPPCVRATRTLGVARMAALIPLARPIRPRRSRRALAAQRPARPRGVCALLSLRAQEDLVPYSEWVGGKKQAAIDSGESPLGVLPVVYVGGKKYLEHVATARYIARRLGARVCARGRSLPRTHAPCL